MSVSLMGGRFYYQSKFPNCILAQTEPLELLLHTKPRKTAEKTFWKSVFSLFSPMFLPCEEKRYHRFEHFCCAETSRPQSRLACLGP